MENIKITSTDKQEQFVEITPAPVQQPVRRIPVEQYIKQLTSEQTHLQAQLDAVEAKLSAVEDAGVDVSAIVTKISK